MTLKTRISSPARAICYSGPTASILQDVLGQTAMLQFMQTRRDQGRRAHDASTATT